MKNSHDRWKSTGDLWRKVDPDDRATYNRTRNLDQFSPKYAEVWTVGQPSSHTTQDPQGRQTVTVEGRRLKPSETSQLRSTATVVNVSVSYPSATVKVTTFAQIEEILEKPFVYMLEFPHDGYKVTETYDANWIRDKEKIDLAKSHRDDDDGSGNGAMPSGVDFHILDTGYDATESYFVEPYADSQITHTHDWTDQSSVSAGENEHGTLVADTLDLMNFGGGSLHIHKIGTDGAICKSCIKQALSHIVNDHSSLDNDVVTMSFAKITSASCQDDFDQYLKPLAMNHGSLISAAMPNPDDDSNDVDPVEVGYPASATWSFGVRGILNHDPWWTQNDDNWGLVELDSDTCPDQYDYHQNRDGALSISKPDVYGSFWIETDTWEACHPDMSACGGTSFATPQIASGLGTIVSRYLVGNDNEKMPWKTWDSTNNCWEDAYKLVVSSASPDGRDVVPDGTNTRDPSKLGDLADHDAWYLNDENCT